MRHEVGGRLTDDGAGHHKAEMLRPQMIAASLQTVRHRHRMTHGVAAHARFDRAPRFLAQLIHANGPKIKTFASTPHPSCSMAAEEEDRFGGSLPVLTVRGPNASAITYGH
jgi:hypothetical protein